MRRELLLIREMIDAAQRAHALVAGGDAESLAADRQRGEALLWNFTVLGEAAAQLDETVKVRFRDVEWARPSQLRNRITQPRPTRCPGLSRSFATCLPNSKPKTPEATALGRVSVPRHRDFRKIGEPASGKDVLSTGVDEPDPWGRLAARPDEAHRHNRPKDLSITPGMSLGRVRV